MSLKRVLRALLPADVYDAGRCRWRFLADRSNVARDRTARRVLAVLRAGQGTLVRDGPFRGMRYLRAVSWGELASKLLGSYEAELHEEMESLLAREYDRVVNVGCAEGYYAVGLARRLPAAEVFAFDPDPYARYLCRRLAARNGVTGRVRVAGSCAPGRLAEVVGHRTLLVVDCEGCELELLRPDLVPALAQTDMVVELHDFVDPETSRAVLERFGPTHETTILESVERDPRAYPLLDTLAWQERVFAVAEDRPDGMKWAVLRARDRPMERGALGRDEFRRISADGH